MRSFYEMLASRASYTALVLNPTEQSKLIAQYRPQIPPGWEVVAHHMTINMGAAEKGPAANFVNTPFNLQVTKLAQDDRVMAVGVETECPSANPVKHVTLAVNRQNGGKPFHSNQLNWAQAQDQPPLNLHGTVQEVS